MKKGTVFLFIISYLYLFSSCASSPAIDVAMKWNSNEKEPYYSIDIFSDGTSADSITIPAQRFHGGQVVGTRVFFIDTQNSFITDYGRLCYYDTSEKSMVWTEIYSGKAFFVTDDMEYVVVTSLYDTGIPVDMPDIFGLNVPPTKRYPLLIDIYDLKKQRLIKNIKAYDNFDDDEVPFINISFEKKYNDTILISYGMYDTQISLYEGVFDLKTYEFKN